MTRHYSHSDLPWLVLCSPGPTWMLSKLISLFIQFPVVACWLIAKAQFSLPDTQSHTPTIWIAPGEFLFQREPASKWVGVEICGCYNTRCWKLNPFFTSRSVWAICCFCMLIKLPASSRFRLWPLPQSTTGTRWIFSTGSTVMHRGSAATQVKPCGLQLAHYATSRT